MKTFTLNDLAWALFWALDAYDLTIRPQTNDEDDPDMDDIAALAARVWDNLGLYNNEEETE